MDQVQAKEARRWVADYERLLAQASLLVFARSKQDRAMLRAHADRLQGRLAFWKARARC